MARILQYVLEGTGVLLFGTGLVYLYWVHVSRRLTVIRPGRVYQSGAMRPAKLAKLVQKLGVDTVVDFRGDAEMPMVQAEQQALAAVGVRHANIPSGCLPTCGELQSFVALMKEELGANRRVLMHCKDGEGRAVAFAAVYRMELEGWSPLAAYRATTRLPPHLRYVTWVLPFACRLSRSNAKSQLILSYAPQAD